MSLPLLDGLLAIARFGHDRHVGLSSDYSHQSLEDDGVIVSEEQSNLRRDGRHGTVAVRCGTDTEIIVPESAALRIESSPPMDETRALIPPSPNPSDAAFASKPRPSSVRRNRTASSEKSISITIRCAC